MAGHGPGKPGVDHTSYDRTSILATIEHSYGLPALSSRDASVNDLTNAVPPAVADQRTVPTGPTDARRRPSRNRFAGPGGAPVGFGA
jgi:hypothetical protein